MTARGVVTMRCQYQTVQEALGAQAWLGTWKQIHGANVRPSGTTDAVSAVIPPTPASPETGPACNGQFDYTVQLEAATDADCLALAQQTMTALATIIAEGGVFDCYGDSGGGYNPVT